LEKISIKIRIYLYLCSLIVFTLIVVSAFFYSFFIQNVKEIEVQDAINSSSEVKQRMELILNSINDTGNLLSTEKEIISILSSEKIIDNNQYKAIKNRSDIKLKDIASINGYIKDIYIIGNNGAVFSSDLRVNGESLRKDFYINTEASEYYSGLHYTPYDLFSNDSVISYVKQVYIYPSGKRVGSVIIDMDLSRLNEVFATFSMRKDEKVVIINSKKQTLFNFPRNVNLDQIISDNYEITTLGKAQLQKKVFGKDSAIVSDTFSNSDWKIVRIISFDEIYKSINKMILMGLRLLFVLLIVSLIVSLMLANSFTKPIIELNNQIKSVENGDFSVNISTRRKDELGELGQSFNKMVIKLKDNINHMLKEQKKRNDMEFEILQAQINPHFLYNTIDSIRWLAVMQNIENISEMTSALISLLKYNISKKSPIVTLEEDIENIKNYERIQKYRYGDTFNIQYQIQEKTLDCKIIKFILQPLVENAIFHGINDCQGEGEIKITSKIQNNDLIIEVEDNGIGMDLENWVNESAKGKKMHTGIGLKNIDERIKLYFGDSYGIQLFSELEAGTIVKLTLPLIKTDEDINAKVKTDDEL
jgi:two-component system, sensor histidine kinase YesM